MKYEIKRCPKVGGWYVKCINLYIHKNGTGHDTCLGPNQSPLSISSNTVERLNG